MTTAAERHIIDTLVDHHHEMDDSDEQLFGTYARTSVDGNTVTIQHETDDAPLVLVTITEQRS